MSTREVLLFIAALFIGVGLLLCAASVPMFINAWEQYKIECPDNNALPECH